MTDTDIPISSVLTPDMLTPLAQPGSRTVVAFIPEGSSAPAILIISDLPAAGALAAMTGSLLFHFDTSGAIPGVVTLSWLPPRFAPDATPVPLFVWAPETVIDAFADTDDDTAPSA